MASTLFLIKYETFPPQGWIRWMDQQLSQARFVLVVCTETYCRRAAGQEAPGIGVGASRHLREGSGAGPSHYRHG
jgi:hypothetical protein